MNFLIQTLSFLLSIASSFELPDPLWLRYDSLVPNPGDYAQIKDVQVLVDAKTCAEDHNLKVLDSISHELSFGLQNLLGRDIPATSICDSPSPEELLSSGSVFGSEDVTFKIYINSTYLSQNGPEGYTIKPTVMTAATPSGALYGAFKLLSFVQRHIPIPEQYSSQPAMAQRSWNLWDVMDGRVERGMSGFSLLWPYALYPDGDPPPRNQLYVASLCDSSDPYQQWEGDTFSTFLPSAVKNVGAQQCIDTMSCDPVTVSGCDDESRAAQFVYNKENMTIASGSTGSNHPDACGRGNGLCLDLNRGNGPDIDIYNCHNTSNDDFTHQLFLYDEDTKQIKFKEADDSHEPRCLTLLPSYPLPDASDNTHDNDPWDPTSPSFYKKRIVEMLRLLKSSGINTLVINNVNACGDVANRALAETKMWTENLGPLFDAWAIQPMLSVCFDGPNEIDQISSDPRDPASTEWWVNKFNEIYERYPRFAGVLVKADSEGNVGPMTFNCTEADGANLLARAIAPHGGKVLWRGFVYGSDIHVEDEKKSRDLARQAYDTFMPLDGKFDDNVVIQIKNGPMDFQIREPPHPLLGGLPKSNIMMEVSAAQQYTGCEIHAVQFTTQWSHYLEWDTMWDMDSNSTTMRSLLTGVDHGGVSEWGGGLACVSNLGNYNNYTGHVLSGANLFACGRLGWDPSMNPAEIDREWAEMTFTMNKKVVDTVVDIVQRTWEVFEGYSSPMGIGFMAGQNNPNGCAPKTDGPGIGPGGMECPIDRDHGDHYWMNPCEDYDFQNSSSHGLGCDRTSIGVGSQMIEVYSPGVQALLDDISTIPEELTLFFHNLAWTDLVSPYEYYAQNDTKVTLFERIRDRHEGALKELKGIAEAWGKLEDEFESKDKRFEGVRARFQQQVNDAFIMRDQIMDFYSFISGLE